ncbi:eukaryotic membrane protein family-domain-containing protein [Infundibulicybe gibba]|nr:eukaryotic membrane protein family-domain-containing protein [Infundibulicybe gibba]
MPVPLTAPLARPRNRRRRTSLSLSPPPATAYSYFRPQLTDASDIGEEDTDGSEHGHSVASDPHIFRARPRHRPMIYASLPPTPISPSPSPRAFIAEPPVTPTSPVFSSTTIQPPEHPFSLWEYLREELLATDFDSHQELKWERVSNFLSIPLAMEKIIGFGFILCFDSFLYTFTILPIRFALALFRFLTNLFWCSAPPLPPSQKADLLRTLLLVVSVMILNPLTDASKIYHTIRGQDTIKLYVIFNALEIGDRLCASIGQDVLDCLFSRSTLEPLSHRMPVTSNTFRPILFFLLATVYNVAHALVMVYQLIALNVAINSYDHALLTLLVSNQFVEIKGSVFKKFEKDSLFQITCADIVERFTLALMLCVVAFRNLIEMSGTEFDFTQGFVLPKSFGWFRGNNVLWTISYPVLTVMVSEMLVDWLKHAFITKFNHIRPSVYERFTDVLCRDLASGSAVGRRGARKHSYVDQSPLVARRLGFASLPLAVLAILIGSQSISLMFAVHSDSSSPWTVPSLSNAEIIHYLKWITMGVLFWLCFVVIKVIMGVNLVSYATRRRAGMEAREEADVVNNFGRDPIGEGKEEQIYNRKLKTLLDNNRDDATPVPEIGERRPGEDVGKKGRVKLEDLTRFTMIKRIW